MQTDMTKTSERISTMESLIEQHREFSRHHSPTRDDQISVDEELLDYSDDDVSLATGSQEQAIKPNYKAMKPS